MTRQAGIRVLLVVAAAGLALVAAPGPALATSSLRWSAPAQIDFGPQYAHADGLGQVSCPSKSLCVSSASGGVAISKSPFTGNHTAWSVTNVSGLPATDSPLGVSCPSATLCVAGDTDGNIVASTRPTGGTSAWTFTHLDSTSSPGDQLRAVSCAVTPKTVCVVADHAGNIWTSTNPTGGSSAWHETTTPTDITVLNGASCPSSSLCLVTGGGSDGNGAIAYSTDPTHDPATWTVTKDVDTASGFINAIDCVSSAFCVAADSGADVLTTSAPTGPATGWTTITTADPYKQAGDFIFAVNCAPDGSLCVAGDTNGNIVGSTDPTSSSSWKGLLSYSAHQHATSGIACPSSSDCIASTDRGSVMTSTKPTGCTSQPTADRQSCWSEVGVDGTNTIDGVLCVSVSECFADDEGGNILASSNPTGGASAWSAANLDYGDPNTGGYQMIAGISCASAAICATGDSGGIVCASSTPVTLSVGSWDCPGGVIQQSTFVRAIACGHGQSGSLCLSSNGTDIFTGWPNPRNPSDWFSSGEEVSAGGDLFSLSCPTSSFCVAGTLDDDLYWSNDPDKGPSATWQETTGLPFPATNLSCPTASFCAAVSDTGDVEFSTNPAVTSSNWSDTPSVDTSGGLDNISCTSSSFCAAADNQGNVFVSTDPTGNSSTDWSEQSLNDGGNGASALTCSGSPPTVLCVVGEGTGDMVFGTEGALTHTLSVAVSGHGAVTGSGISCPKTCSHAYGTGTAVTLTATPASGYRFVGWSGGGCKGTGTCKVTMSANEKVTAKFLPVLQVIGSPTSNGKAVIVKLSCSGAKSCASKETLTQTGKHTVVGKTAATIPAGKTETVTVSLNSAGQTLLKRDHKLHVTLTVALVQGQKTIVEATRTLTINEKA